MDFKISEITDLVNEVTREIKYREYVYPQRVASKKMTETEKQKRIENMKKVLSILEEIKQSIVPKQQTLF